jgi:hypothetical protein
MRLRLISGLLLILFLFGCNDREPVTVVFTGDVKGRLRPAG